MLSLSLSPICRLSFLGGLSGNLQVPSFLDTQVVDIMAITYRFAWTGRSHIRRCNIWSLFSSLACQSCQGKANRSIYSNLNCDRSWRTAVWEQLEGFPIPRHKQFSSRMLVVPRELEENLIPDQT
jgi:hypothetical protein